MPPVIGTSPQVGFSPYTPHQQDGVRIEPPWSPPSAMSTSPAATRVALPPDEPPVLCSGLCGLRMGPVAPKILSLPATVLPARTPSFVPLISHRQYQALYGFSSGGGR